MTTPHENAVYAMGTLRGRYDAAWFPGTKGRILRAAKFLREVRQKGVKVRAEVEELKRKNVQ